MKESSKCTEEAVEILKHSDDLKHFIFQRDLEDEIVPLIEKTISLYNTSNKPKNKIMKKNFRRINTYLNDIKNNSLDLQVNLIDICKSVDCICNQILGRISF